MEQSPASKADSLLAGQEIPRPYETLTEIDQKELKL
jgi:hypothetical protein